MHDYGIALEDCHFFYTNAQLVVKLFRVSRSSVVFILNTSHVDGINFA